MIKVIELIVEDTTPENDVLFIRAKLLSDTKEEVIEMGNRPKQVQGLSEANVVLTMGSKCMTTNFEMGILNSDGQWNFK